MSANNTRSIETENTKKIDLSNDYGDNKHVSYTSSLIKFKWLYSIKPLWGKVLVAIALGLVVSFFTTLFIKNTSLYTGGTSAFFYGIARVVRTALEIKGTSESTTNVVYNGLFWGLYLLMNIPLTIFAYYKISKKFAILSFSYLGSAQLFGFLLGLIPGFQLNIFGNTDAVNTYMSAHYSIDTIIFNPNIIPMPGEFTVLEWGNPQNWIFANTINNPAFPSEKQEQLQTLLSLAAASNFQKTLSLFVYATTFSFISATSVAMLFIIGGSSAGSDYLVIWINTAKHKGVGKTYTLMNLCFMLCGVLLGNYVTGILAWGDIVSKYPNLPIESNPFTNASYLFSANMLASLMWVVVNGIIIGKLFPSEKLVKVEIASTKVFKIDEAILNDQTLNIFHVYKIEKSDNSSSLKTIKIICSYFEFNEIIKHVTDIDPSALVVSSYITDIQGPKKIAKKLF